MSSPLCGTRHSLQGPHSLLPPAELKLTPGLHTHTPACPGAGGGEDKRNEMTSPGKPVSLKGAGHADTWDLFQTFGVL